MEILLQAALMALGIVALITGVVYVITRLPDMPDGQWRRQLEPYLTVRNAALGAGMLALLFLFLGLLNGEDFWANLFTEMLSVALTVLIIDALYEKGRKADRKQQIIEQMGSPVNDAALEAVRLVRKYGWLEDGSLTEVDLEGANLKGANLEGAKLEMARMKDARFQSANMMSADLRSARLWNSDLSRTDLAFSQLQGADLYRANLKASRLYGANLEGSHMYKAILEDADVSQANICSVRLSDARLHGAYFQGTRCNNATIWPEGFDWRAAGVINVDEQDAA